jgi:hypothetical protein
MAKFVRVSLPHGHFTVPAATAERGGWTVLEQGALDKFGRPLPPKPRETVEAALATPKRRHKKKSAPKLRDETAAATPTPEAPASDASTEE